MFLEGNHGGQFAPAEGGQFESATHGQFKSAEGGQIDRSLQYIAICITQCQFSILRWFLWHEVWLFT